MHRLSGVSLPERRRLLCEMRFSALLLGFLYSLTIANLFGAVYALADPPDVPIRPGVTFVLATADSTIPTNTSQGILHGDYEMVVTIDAVTPDGITQKAAFDGFDAAGIHKEGSVVRKVTAPDLANARVQIFGFLSDDLPLVPGTTSLGPSLAVVRELLQKGEVLYSFRNFVGRETVSGTLRTVSRIKFPVLLNGKRVELDAVRATGQMAAGSSRRPFETVILDHPLHPISLRVAYGPRNGTFPFKPDFAREVVRIDFSNPQNSVAEALTKRCRVEARGLYFDFNQATLKSRSEPALREIAEALKKMPQRRITIEGHTDDIGTDRYNDELSARRADAVKQLWFMISASMRQRSPQSATVNASLSRQTPLSPAALETGASSSPARVSDESSWAQEKSLEPQERSHLR